MRECRARSPAVAGVLTSQLQGRGMNSLTRLERRREDRTVLAVVFLAKTEKSSEYTFLGDGELAILGIVLFSYHRPANPTRFDRGL